MGISIRIQVFLICVSMMSCMSQRNIDDRAKTIFGLKKYALCTCLITNYHNNDSSMNLKDLSKSYITQSESIPIEWLNLVDSFTKNKANQFYLTSSYVSDEYGKGYNTILNSCSDFVNSAELDSFVHKVIHRK